MFQWPGGWKDSGWDQPPRGPEATGLFSGVLTDLIMFQWPRGGKDSGWDQPPRGPEATGLRAWDGGWQQDQLHSHRQIVASETKQLLYVFVNTKTLEIEIVGPIFLVFVVFFYGYEFVWRLLSSVKVLCVRVDSFVTLLTGHSTVQCTCTYTVLQYTVKCKKHGKIVCWTVCLKMLYCSLLEK